jgi:heptosyltransferase II
MNIILIQTAFIGDVILTTPLFQEIKKVYPGSCLSVVVNSGVEELLSENPYIDSIITIDKKKIKKSIFSFLQFIRSIRNRKFDLCISAHFSYRSSLISFLSGARVRVGYKQAGFSFLHTKVVDRPVLNKHEVDKLFSLIYTSEKEYPGNKRPQIYFSESEAQKYRQLLLGEDLPDRNYIIVAPSSMWETKKMPSDRFIDLIRLILEHTGYSVVLIGSKSDNSLCEEIAGHFPKNCRNLAGKTTLKELAFVIQHSVAVVSNDSSPIHLASAFDIPCVAIFGATVPAFGYTPLSQKQFIAEVNDLDCRPCGIHGGKNCPKSHFRCMKEQNITRIFDELKKLI